MASSYSSSSQVAQKHDVFISFRGRDIRHNFLSHLKKYLHDKQIDAYVDDRLVRGEEISSALLKAIEKSLISLVIFSKDYASSKWCLEELVKIIECMERNEQTVIPVFYNIDPSDVRHQNGTYGEALARHEEKFKENMIKVQSWRYALTKAANLSGFHYSSQYQNESEVIEKIVKDILGKFCHIYPSESKVLVGIDESIECIESLLVLESREVQILGIWGMGGIGKTTIAQAVFDKFSSQYEGCCFLENVREKSQKNGLHSLHQKLLSELLEEENHLLNGSAKAQSTIAKRRLSRKKVFIVLDDVNTSEQLELLIGEQNCLGPDSRVIVTTRDKHVLRGVHGIYEVQGLNFQNSLQLFCLNAFSKIYPEMGYEKLSEMVVVYAKGIPLALKVLGSFLYSRSKEAWESALRKLRIYPNVQIHNVLKLSYDGLDDLEKDIFLDIAFFFKGCDKDDVIRLLDSSGFYAAIGIDILVDKALVTISNANKIQMHDMIEEMGWEIVRQESIKDPGKRSRLKDPDDIYDVLKNSRGTHAVEGIMLDLSQTRDLHLSVDSFKKMPNLRFLQFYTPWYKRSSNVYVPTDLESFSDKLRYFEWNGYPLKSLPSTFCPEKLVKFRMQQSHVNKLWDGVQDLVNLKEIDLHGCKQLIELPDFSKASNLERVNLSCCESLCHVHPSILSIHTLVRLNVDGCKELKSLKSKVHFRSLKYLDVDGCSNLKEFSVSSEELRKLNLRDTRIDILHPTISRLSKLEWFDLSDLRLQTLPNELCLLRSLEELWLSGCKQVIELPHNIKVLSRLKVLWLRNCTKLRSLPELPSSIRSLDATNCTSLEIVFSLTGVFSLNRKYTSFENCTRLDEHSLCGIMEDAHFTMMRAAIGNKFARGAHLSKWKTSEFNSGKVCYPGSRVPDWFRYQTRQASITIELDPHSNLLGFFFCCVLSQVPSNKKYHTVECKYCLGDGKRASYENGWQYATVTELDLDHVYVWYDPSHCGSLLRGIKKGRTSDHNQKVSFEFIIRTYKLKPENFKFAETHEHDCLIKECGVFPIYLSEYQNVIQNIEMELEIGAKSKKYQDIDELKLSTLECLVSLKR